MKLRNMTCLFLTGPEGLLCLYRIGSRVADRMYVGAAGGHFEKEELNDPRTCVLREMKEELGLEEADLEDLKLRYVAMRLKNGEIRQNYYYFASLKTHRDLESTEGALEWVSWEKLSELEMPACAKLAVLHYLREGRYTDKVYGAVACREGTRFVALEEFADQRSFSLSHDACEYEG